MKATYKIEFGLCSEGFRKAAIERLNVIGPFWLKHWQLCDVILGYKYEGDKKVEVASDEIIDEAIKRLKEIAEQTNKNQEWRSMPDLLFDENGNRI